MSEQLHRFGKAAHLCGILNMSPSAVRNDDRPAVIFITAGLLHKPGPFRLYVELSRTLAAIGIPALRFDLSGIGESGRAEDTGSAEQASVNDVRDAMDSLAAELGARRFVLAGLCSGAEVAHRTAVIDERVCGVIAMDGYILRTPAYYWRHYLPRVFSLRKWLDFFAHRIRRMQKNAKDDMEGSPEDEALAFWDGPGPDRDQLVSEFKTLCRREVRQLQIFSGGSGDCSYEGQFHDAFADVDFKDLLDVRFLPETDHVYVLQADRRRLVRVITRWLGKHFLAEPATGALRTQDVNILRGQPAFMQNLVDPGNNLGRSIHSPHFARFTGRRNLR